MESNLGQQTPKLNVTNVSSAVFGKDGPALGKESKIGTLSRILRTTRIKVNNVEKVAAVSKDKISRIINILKTQQMTTGEKLPSPKKKPQSSMELEQRRISKLVLAKFVRKSKIQHLIMIERNYKNVSLNSRVA